MLLSVLTTGLFSVSNVSGCNTLHSSGGKKVCSNITCVDELKCFMYLKVPIKVILIRFKTAALKKSGIKLTTA